VSYAIRNDGMGWRAVAGPQDCSADEFWQEAQPAVITTAAKIMSVTPVQAYTALDKMGVLAQVMAFVDAPTTPPLVRLAWLGATEFRRDSLLVMNAAIVLGWTDAQLDALFDVAATL
jgi:hypothetical protein